MTATLFIMDRTSAYRKAYEEAQHFISCYSPPLSDIAKMSTVCSLVKSAVPEFVYVGFYLMARLEEREILEVGPYQGEVLACARIELTRGVCGKAAAEKQTQVVQDVTGCLNYIACDDKTQSEVVVPVIRDGNVIAVFDIDCGQKDFFTPEDVEWLTKFAELI